MSDVFTIEDWLGQEMLVDDDPMFGGSTRSLSIFDSAPTAPFHHQFPTHHQSQQHSPQTQPEHQHHQGHHVDGAAMDMTTGDDSTDMPLFKRDPSPLMFMDSNALTTSPTAMMDATPMDLLGEPQQMPPSPSHTAAPTAPQHQACHSHATHQPALNTATFPTSKPAFPTTSSAACSNCPQCMANNNHQHHAHAHGNHSSQLQAPAPQNNADASSLARGGVKTEVTVPTTPTMTHGRTMSFAVRPAAVTSCPQAKAPAPGSNTNSTRSSRSHQSVSSGPAPTYDVKRLEDLTDHQLATIDFKVLMDLAARAGLNNEELAEIKAKRRRLKNRLSARICSNKKREKCTELEETNKQLTAQVKSLTTENSRLQNMNVVYAKDLDEYQQEVARLNHRIEHLTRLLLQQGASQSDLDVSHAA